MRRFLVYGILAVTALHCEFLPPSRVLAQGLPRCARTDQVINLIGDGSLGTGFKMKGVEGQSRIANLIKESSSPKELLRRIARKDKEVLAALRGLTIKEENGETVQYLMDWRIDLAVGYARESLVRDGYLTVPKARIPEITEVSIKDVLRPDTSPLKPSLLDLPGQPRRETESTTVKSPPKLPGVDFRVEPSPSGFTVRIPPRQQIRGRELARALGKARSH